VAFVTLQSPPRSTWPPHTASASISSGSSVVARASARCPLSRRPREQAGRDCRMGGGSRFAT
jgi:hypothetical protein